MSALCMRCVMVEQIKENVFSLWPRIQRGLILFTARVEQYYEKEISLQGTVRRQGNLRHNKVIIWQI